jgi:hypothetical protein
MKSIIVIATLVSSSTIATAQNYHNGYTRQNGTYVAPHYQSAPDNSRTNNYSAQGNTNPYTGQAGTVNPYAQPNPYAAPTTPHTNNNSIYGTPRRY